MRLTAVSAGNGWLRGWPIAATNPAVPPSVVQFDARRLVDAPTL